MGVVAAIEFFWSNMANPAIGPQTANSTVQYMAGLCINNGPHEYAVNHTSSYVISKLFTQTFLIGRGDVTFLHIACVKSTKNVGKLTCVFGRFKDPFFLWLIQILKAVTMIMVTAIEFFWSFMRNPATNGTTKRRCGRWKFWRIHNK
jgi:hypothetical protein